MKSQTTYADHSGPVPSPAFLDRGIHRTLMTGLLNALAPVQHRGLSRIIGMLKVVLPLENKLTHAKLSSDAIFSFPTYDDYWSYFLLTGRSYEPEIASFLIRLKGTPFGFLDCGANFGYWSVLVGSAAFGSHPAVAIEASSATFRSLERNAQLNGDRFLCLQRAISDRAGRVVGFSQHRHHGSRSIIPGTRGNQRRQEEVQTETVDNLIATRLPTVPSIVCKLDVEGAEIAAFEGATEAFARDVVFIYEDHGKDRDCIPSRYLLDRRMEVFSITPSTALRRIANIEELRAEKTNKKRGYNFIALGGRGPLCDLVRSFAAQDADQRR